MTGGEAGGFSLYGGKVKQWSSNGKMKLKVKQAVLTRLMVATETFIH
jgi:hypothetical protein